MTFVPVDDLATAGQPATAGPGVPATATMAQAPDATAHGWSLWGEQET